MISKLRLINFQSHEDSELVFHPGFNVIVGPSDSGKTAIVRALEWLRKNRPAGDAFRSTWGGDTTVTGTFEDPGRTNRVTRFKGKDGNAYALTTDEDTEEFKAFGQGVPAEILAAMNLTDLNVQTQLDPPFMLSLSPGEIARTLNEVANLDEIDRALSNIVGKKMRIRSDLKYANADRAQMEETLEGFEYLAEMEEDIQAVEKKAAEHKEAEGQAFKLAAVLVSIEEVRETIAGTDKILRHEEAVRRILGKQADFQAFRSVRDELAFLLEDIKHRRADLDDAARILGAEPRAMSVLKKIGKRDELTRISAGLTFALSRIGAARKEVEDRSAEIRDLEAQKPDLCPVCGGKLKKT